MRVLGFDIETTGLDTKEDRIIEVGAVVWDVEKKMPLHLYSQFVKPVPEKLPLSPEIVKITGIEEPWLAEFGKPVEHVLLEIGLLINQFKVDFILAHNGENYDKPLTMAELARAGILASPLAMTPWLDTRMDLPFEEEPQSRKLNHLAYDHEFINPFQHRAVFDVLTMLKVASFYDFEKIVANAKIPWAVMRALVEYNDREKAKKLRYSWEQLGDDKWPKCWVKKVRENMVDAEAEAAAKEGFKSVRIA